MLKLFPNKLVLFLSLTFLMTWGLGWGAMAIFHIPLTSSIGNVMHIFSGLSPTIAAIMCLEDKSLSGLKTFLFSVKRNSWQYLILLSVLLFLVFSLSSVGISGRFSNSLIPILLIQAILIGGGNEELGWRGTMQPLLEEKISYWKSSLLTGFVWGIWHLPLWFIEGSIQQQFPYYQFLIYAVIFSFVLATLYRKTQSVFFCMILHGLNNVILAYFIIEANLILLIGLIILWGISVCLANSDDMLK